MIELQPFTLEDAPRLIEWAISPEFLVQWTGLNFEYPLDRGQIERRLRQAAGPEPPLMPFKAVDRVSGERVGYIELHRIDRQHSHATVGCVIVGPESRRGQGIGTRMVREVVRIGFAELGLHRIDLAVFDFNAPAVACYRKAGFRIEGRLREARRVGDEFWTPYLMSLLRHEWQAETAAQPQGDRALSGGPVLVRPATAGDIAAILDFIRQMAEFDGCPEAVEATSERLRETLFGDTPLAGILLAEAGGAAVGFASYHSTYSTFLARPGIWLDDLFVDAGMRSQGIGTALLRHLARLAKQRGCGRIEWTVAAQNHRGIEFYQRNGARLSERARLCRLDRGAIERLAAESDVCEASAD